MVIIILGILAALAIPQFSTTTEEAKEATLKTSLANWRRVIQRYYHEHDSTYPGAVLGDGSGTPTANPAQSETVNRRQLKKYTKKTGEVSDTLDRVNYPYGPYFEKLPENPMNGMRLVKVVGTGAPIEADAIDGTTGWVYNKVTGEIRGNTTGYLSY
jgi:general secretion pathway protein G